MSNSSPDITSSSFKPVVLYELVSGEDRSRYFSPNTYLTRMTLGYKGIPFEVVPLTLIEVSEKIPKVLKSASNVLGLPSGVVNTVPVIHDPNTDTMVQDSWRIAQYLDETYPKKPILHNQPNIQLLLHDLIRKDLLYVAMPLIILDAFSKFDQPSAKYFRETREKIFGKSLEEFAVKDADGQKAILSKLRQNLVPFREAIKRSGGYLSDKVNVSHVDFFLAGMMTMVNYGNVDCFRDIFLTLEDGTHDNTMQDFFLSMQNFVEKPN
ncbi:hypothetical protein K7432_009408 [Basidiobolus ranarum]|uniref:GST N-terminal domain-containing protein n=1 Tax=Basidiobolus ranarum TaxID=34480 RepID=A0ABR2VX33_9FUNG